MVIAGAGLMMGLRAASRLALVAGLVDAASAPTLLRLNGALAGVLLLFWGNRLPKIASPGPSTRSGSTGALSPPAAGTDHGACPKPHPELKRKVWAGLELIRTDPEVGKELRDEPARLRSLRVGRFRIVYRVVSRRLIALVAIGPRRTSYQETFRLLRRA